MNYITTSEVIDPKVRLRDGVSADYRPDMLAHEEKCLAPFFEAMAERHSIPVSHLSRIFNLQAQRTGVFLSSNFSILSERDFKFYSCSEEAGFSSFSVDKTIRENVLGFGFIQHFKERNTFAIPALFISDEMSDIIKPHNSDKLIEALGRLYTYANHDYMHHLAPETVSSSVVKRHCSKRSHVNRLLHHDRDFNSSIETGTESFFLTTHLHNFQHAVRNNERFAASYQQTCDTVLSEIGRISNLILNSGEGFAQEKKASRFVNYFGNVALFGMARVCDISMDETAIRFAGALARMDPLPGHIPHKSLFNLLGNPSRRHRIAEDFEKIREARVFEVLNLSERINRLTVERRRGNMPDDQAHIRIEGKFLKAIEQDITLFAGPQALA